MAMNSTPEDINKKMGVFWGLAKTNRIFGMMIIIFGYNGEEFVSDKACIIIRITLL